MNREIITHFFSGRVLERLYAKWHTIINSISRATKTKQIQMTKIQKIYCQITIASEAVFIHSTTLFPKTTKMVQDTRQFGCLKILFLSLLPLLFKYREEPVKGFADARVALAAVYLDRYNRRVIPRAAFFIGVLVVIEPVDEINGQGRLVGDGLGAVVKVAGDADEHRFFLAPDDLGEPLGLFIVGADLHRTFEDQEVIDLTQVMPVPGPDGAGVTVTKIGLGNPFIDKISPVLP